MISLVRNKQTIIYTVSFLIFFTLSNFNLLATFVSDTLSIDNDSSKTIATHYIPGTDITEQLKNDLNAGLNVNLPAGHFYVSESIIIQGYSGIIKGESKYATIIEAAQGFKALEDPTFSSNERLTEIFALYWPKGDVTFENMTIQIKGDAPAEVHNNPFFGMSKTIDNAIVVAGIHSEASNGIMVTIKNLKIAGENSTDSLSRNGKNLALPLIVIGLQGSKSVSLVIKNCEIKNSGEAAIEYGNVFGGSGIIIENEITNCYAGISMISKRDSLILLGTITIKDNKFNKITSHVIGNWNTWSSYCFKNNTLNDLLMTDDCK